jgi:hypothetical protein
MNSSILPLPKIAVGMLMLLKRLSITRKGHFYFDITKGNIKRFMAKPPALRNRLLYLELDFRSKIRSLKARGLTVIWMN